MRVLFLVYHGFENASGISKKILAQVKGLRQNGHEVHVCYYDISVNNEHQRIVDGFVIKNYGTGRLASLYQRMSYGCICNYCRQSAIELVYVRSFMNASPFNIWLFRQLRKDGVKAVMEIPTYPYDKEFVTLPLKYRLEHIFDIIFRKRLASYMNAIVTFSDADCIFGQKTIKISNGVDLDAIPVLKKSGDGDQNILHVIGVAEVHPWHAFDRFVAGLGEYYLGGKGKRENEPDVYFHIVGGIPSSLMERDYLPLIEKYGLQDKVVFHGKLYGDDLDMVFAQCNFAVGSLGRHRSGITQIKTLKNREYACRGIPFMYSEMDSDFDNQPYVLKAPADESPIEIGKVLEFIDKNSFSPESIRQTVEHLSWKIQMAKVMDGLTKMEML